MIKTISILILIVLFGLFVNICWNVHVINKKIDYVRTWESKIVEVGFESYDDHYGTSGQRILVREHFSFNHIYLEHSVLWLLPFVSKSNYFIASNIMDCNKHFKELWY